MRKKKKRPPRACSPTSHLWWSWDVPGAKCQCGLATKPHTVGPVEPPYATLAPKQVKLYVRKNREKAEGASAPIRVFYPPAFIGGVRPVVQKNLRKAVKLRNKRTGLIRFAYRVTLEWDSYLGALVYVFVREPDGSESYRLYLAQNSPDWAKKAVFPCIHP